MRAHITLLPGDGVGPEIVGHAARLLECVARCAGHEFELEPALIGGAAMDATGRSLPPETSALVARTDAVLLGAVGGPRWDREHGLGVAESGLLELRRQMKVFANLRPVRALPGLEYASPLRAERLRGVDLLFVRELTGGIYFGPKEREQRDGLRSARDTMVYDETEIRRVVRLAFELARGRSGKLTSIDKANVLLSMRLWREVATEVSAEYPDVTLEHQLVDSAAMRLVSDPTRFDVIVAGNMFGDILSDEGAVLTGSLGVLPSASIGAGRCGLFEPVHGSAPDLAGRGTANPAGQILSAALLLRHSLGLEREAGALERALIESLRDGFVTPDLADPAANNGRSGLDSAAVTEAVEERLEAILSETPLGGSDPRAPISTAPCEDHR